MPLSSGPPFFRVSNSNVEGRMSKALPDALYRFDIRHSAFDIQPFALAFPKKAGGNYNPAAFIGVFRR